MIKYILNWISDELQKHREYKLELKRCHNCDSYAELLRLEKFEREKLIGEIFNKSNSIIKDDIINEDNNDKPISLGTPSRVKRLSTMHDSFRKQRQLEKEFLEEQKKSEVISVDN